jgi:hypothetical protein
MLLYWIFINSCFGDVLRDNSVEKVGTFLWSEKRSSCDSWSQCDIPAGETWILGLYDKIKIQTLGIANTVLVVSKAHLREF